MPYSKYSKKQKRLAAVAPPRKKESKAYEEKADEETNEEAGKEAKEKEKIIRIY